MIGSKVTRRYAKALMSLGQEDGNYEKYGQDLQEFTVFCRNNNEFKEAIANRVFSIDERRQVLQAVLKKSDISDMVKNFLKQQYLLKNREATPSNPRLSFCSHHDT